MDYEKSSAYRGAPERHGVWTAASPNGRHPSGLRDQGPDGLARGWARPEVLAMLAQRGPVWPWPSQPLAELRD
jgi:hypothetical protein